MVTVDAWVRVVHTVFAALWAGGTIFAAVAALPAARASRIDADSLSAMLDRFAKVSLFSIVALLLTGGHLAGQFYTFGSLRTTGRGHLVLAMVALWFVLAGVLHVGTARIERGLAETDVREAISRGQGWYYAGAAISVVLLVVAGLL